MSTELKDPDFNPSQRRLCPDGTCVGVIGEDGKCKLCGTQDPAGPPVANANVQDPAGPPVADANVPAPPSEPPAPAPVPVAGDAFDPSRRLCPDEACIGVLDDAGRCKVCGRS